MNITRQFLVINEVTAGGFFDSSSLDSTESIWNILSQSPNSGENWHILGISWKICYWKFCGNFWEMALKLKNFLRSGEFPKAPQNPLKHLWGSFDFKSFSKIPQNLPETLQSFFNLGARDISRKFPLNSRRFPNFLDFLQILGKVIWLWGVLRNPRKFPLSWEMRILLELPSSVNFWGILRKLPKSNDPHQV